jgi:alkylation response protein AidB-like acyl-CoA dehydrogenase
MDFRFSEEQEALRASVRDALSGWLPRERLFAAIDDGATLPPGRWEEMAALGWTGLLVPEEHGGAGCGLVDMTVVCEEMGRLPLPGPFLSSAVMAVLAAKALGATDLLRGLADGTTLGTVALDEAGTHGDPIAAVATRASADGDGYVLDGLKPVVLDGARADVVIVVARDDDGVAGFLVEDAPAEVVPGLDPTREVARVVLASTPARRLGPAGDQTALWRRFVDDAGIMLCAELVGACDAAFDAAGEYAKTRVQFGRPIGSFQAIKHIAAEMLQSLTLARVGAHYAAWCSDTEAPDREQAAAMAKSWVAEAAVHVTGDAIQVHGGVGFTWEAGAHLWYKRAKANDLMLGRQGWHRTRVADLVLGPAELTASA